MNLGDVAAILEAKVLWGSEQLQQEVLHVFAADMMSNVLLLADTNDILLTNLIGNQVIRTASMTDLAAIIICGNKEPDSQVLALTKKLNIPLFIVSLSLFSCCGLLYEAGLRARGEQ